MDIQKYNKATEILNKIEHINKVIEFINNVKRSGLLITMWESGFVSRPDRITLEEWQYDHLIESYEYIKRNLKQELEEL